MWLDILNGFKKESGKTTEQIAEESGIPKGTLNKLFAGQTKDPQYSTIFKVVHCLGHTVDELAPIDQTKIASNPDESELEAGAWKLYRALIAGGYVKEGEDITEKQLEILDGLSAIIAASFDDED